MSTVKELLAKQEEASGAKLEDLKTVAARKERYARLREKMSRSKLAVTDGEPGIHYFWADKGDTGEIARLEGLGYTFVREVEPLLIMKGEKTPTVRASGLKEDGTYVVGDVILMQCDQEVYEFIMLANSERHEELASGAQRDFRTEAESNGVPVFDHIK